MNETGEGGSSFRFGDLLKENRVDTASEKDPEARKKKREEDKAKKRKERKKKQEQRRKKRKRKTYVKKGGRYK